MGRHKERLLEHLREQMELLRTSVEVFYSGKFAESLRIATTLRILVHETSKSKSLLQQVRPDGLQLPILDLASEPRPDELEVFRFAVGVRFGPGPSVSPAINLTSDNYSPTTIGAWWGKLVFRFSSRLGPQVTYKRRQVILILANKEGGAHVDRNEDPDYRRLLIDVPLGFGVNGVRVQTPDLARFLTAQSGVQMLHCLKQNFFPDVDLPMKWEYGTPPPVAYYIDQISAMFGSVAPLRPKATLAVSKRNSS